MASNQGLFSGNDKLISLLVFLLGFLGVFFDGYFFGKEIDPNILGMCIGATVATIFIPGAGLSVIEGWQKWALTHSTMALLGIVAGAATLGIIHGQMGPFTSILGVAACTSVFVAFWSVAHQSQVFIMEVHEKSGWHEKYPAVNLLVGTLSSGRIKRHDIAREVREAVMDQNLEKILEEDAWRQLETIVLQGTTGNHKANLKGLLAEVRAELEGDTPRLRVLEQR